jgi:predicted Fe-Mo cluster-binding NifX family protein
MKICMPVEGLNGLNERIFGHFGSSPYFLIYDTETKEIKTVKNTNENHIHGACQPTDLLKLFSSILSFICSCSACQPTDLLKSENISAVIISGIGINALLKLKNANIKIYILKPEDLNSLTVEKVINLFNENKLIELTEVIDCCDNTDHNQHYHMHHHNQKKDCHGHSTFNCWNNHHQNC